MVIIIVKMITIIIIIVIIIGLSPTHHDDLTIVPGCRISDDIRDCSLGFKIYYTTARLIMMVIVNMNMNMMVMMIMMCHWCEEVNWNKSSNQLFINFNWMQK